MPNAAGLTTRGPETLLCLDSIGNAPMLSGTRTAPEKSFVSFESTLLEIESRINDIFRRRFLGLNEVMALVLKRLEEHFVYNKK